MNNTRARINLQVGEFEFEGSQEFVENQLENLDSLVELMAELRDVALDDDVDIPELDANGEENSGGGSTAPEDLSMPSSFGEWMHKFRDDVNNTDKALITAYFVQKQSAEDDFKTREVNKSLTEHGIKLGNPSETLKRLIGKKSLFQTRKNGAVKFFRVSQDGLKHLKSLLRS